MVRLGDILTHINDVSIEGYSFSSVRECLYGPSGTSQALHPSPQPCRQRCRAELLPGTSTGGFAVSEASGEHTWQARTWSWT